MSWEKAICVGEIERSLMLIVIACCAWKERVHVSICSVMYFSNFVAFDGSGYVMRRQYNVRCITLKQA
jgi:hypothetical protein